jgi:flavorubredoxin
MSEIHEITQGIYRISILIPESPVTFTQFLIRDEQPLLYHTGPRACFQETLEAIRKVMDPSGIRYISWSHLEADECGALNDFLQIAPQAEPVTGMVGVFLSVSDFFNRPVRGMNDGEILDLGEHKLRFLITPHVPHAWDAILTFEEKTGTLLASDLFTHLGETRPITDKDIVDQALAVHKQYPEYLPYGSHTSRVFDRLEALNPRVLAGHHAPAYSGDAVQALKEMHRGLREILGRTE